MFLKNFSFEQFYFLGKTYGFNGFTDLLYYINLLNFAGIGHSFYSCMTYNV